MSIYFGLFIYIVIVYIIAFSNGKNNFRKKMFLIESFIPLILVMGLRDKTIGVDTKGYCNLFQLYSKMDFKTLIVTGGGDGSTDYLYLIYNKILSFICKDSRIIIFGNALIVCLLAMKLIYKQCNKYIFTSTVLFVVMCHYMYYFNATRQGMAILIMANAIFYLKNKELKKYILSLIVAVLIHTTSIIYILFIPFFFIKLNKKNIITFCFIATIALTSWEYFLKILSEYSTHYQIYLGNEILTVVGGNRKLIYTLIYLLFGVVLLFCKTSNEEENKEKKILLMLDFLLVVSGILYLKNWIFVRIEDYFSIYDIFLIPFAIDKFKKYKLLANFLVIIVMLLGMYMRLSSGYAGVVPYKTWILN